ncbi:hypothetical protein TRFO_04770 [Tritrichomonas foetus]|uniref:RSE1/DDB1/CPSF1 C-terminal domain-containing protein n=1 Tax=Tritrichomonas foetus TaxID=1144522 RepID=A0A1J4KBU5_9EUKA|nr:hypothetical protein TRFO_04770 [Tritrichomonas foetus]|eukprot:OHT08699.1 hypothetical protein TRFO_04770 [Tritrichomonas foetus]
MNFLHYPIIPQSSFLFSTILKSTTNSRFEVLFAYKNRIEIGTILSTKDSISLDMHDEFYIETPLISAISCDDHLISFTENNTFIITSGYPSFNLIYKEQLEQHDFKFFSLSWNHRFICAATNQNNFLIFDIQSFEEPLIDLIIFDDKKILDVTADKSDNVFAFLVENSEGNKETVLFDANNQNIIETYPEESDSISYIKSCDQKSRQFLTLHPYYISNRDKKIFEFTTEVKKVSAKVNETIHMIFQDDSFLTYNVKFDSVTMYSNSPTIDYIFALSNYLMIYKTKETNVFLTKTAENKKGKMKMNFGDLEGLDIVQNNNVDQLFQFNSKLFFFDKNNGIYKINQKINQDKRRILNRFEDDGNIFALQEEFPLFSFNNKTLMIKEYGSNSSYQTFMTEKRTLGLIHFRRRPIQVTSDGLYCDGKLEVNFKHKIMLAASKGDLLVVVLTTNEIILYEKTFKKESSFEIDLEGATISSVDISQNFIAIACFNEEIRSGQIFLLDFDFNGYGQEFSIPSKVTKLFFRNNSTEIFAVYENGSIMKCLITKEQGLTSNVSYIFHGQSPIYSTMVDDDSFTILSNEKLFLYYSNRVFRASRARIKSVAYDGDSLLIVDKNRRLYAVPLKEIEEAYYPKLINTEENSQYDISHQDNDTGKENDKGNNYSENDKNMRKKKKVNGKNEKIDSNDKSEVNNSAYDDKNSNDNNQNIKMNKENKSENEEKDEEEEEEEKKRSKNVITMKNQNIIQIECFFDFVFQLSKDKFYVKHSIENFLLAIDIQDPKLFIVFKKSQFSIRIIILTTKNSLLYIKFKPLARILTQKCEHFLHSQVDLLSNWNDYLLISMKGNLIVAKFIKNILVFTHAYIERKQKITHLQVIKDSIWIALNDNTISVYKLNLECERFELIAEDMGFCESKISIIHPIDEITVVICYENGIIYIKEIPNNAAHGFLQQYHVGPIYRTPKLNLLVKINLYDQVSYLLPCNKLLIYSTKSGSIGAFMPISSHNVFNDLSEMQNKMRKSHLENVGFCVMKRDSLCGTNGIIDYGFIESFLQNEKNTDFLQFYNSSTLSCILQYINF